MRKTFLLILFVCFAIFLGACQSSEEKARTLFNQAQLAAQEQEGEKVVALLQQIVDEYPGTETATTAIQELNNIRAMVEMRQKERLDSPRWAAVQAYKHTLAFFMDQNRAPQTAQELLDAGFKPEEGISYAIAFVPPADFLVLAGLTTGEALFLYDSRQQKTEAVTTEAVKALAQEFETADEVGALTLLKRKS